MNTTTLIFEDGSTLTQSTNDEMMTNAEIIAIEAERFGTFEEAERNADDLANDDMDADVIPVGDKFAIVIIRD